MNPKVKKWHTDWWVLTFTDLETSKRRSVFADSWLEAMALVAHGYRMGYLRGKQC